MKPANIVLDSLYKFTQTQKNSMDTVCTDIMSLKEKQIGLDTFNTLNNAIKELEGIRDNIVSRLLSSMKRGDMIKD